MTRLYARVRTLLLAGIALGPALGAGPGLADSGAYYRYTTPSTNTTTTTPANTSTEEFIPSTIVVAVPFVSGTPPSCDNPFPAAYAPYTNVSAKGVTDHMSVASDGTVCSVGLSSPDDTWNNESHTSAGTVTATDVNGVTSSMPVTFGEIAFPH